MVYVGQTSRNLRQRYQEHIRYIRHNNPQSAYAQCILNIRHEYEPIDNTMSLLKHINNTSMLPPYEQIYNQTLQHYKQLIFEQSTGEHNPLYQLIHDTSYTFKLMSTTDQYPPYQNQFHPESAWKWSSKT
jgi:hypothetical protein